MINYYDDILNAPTNYVFVAIDCSDKFKHVYDEIIYPAIVDAGMVPIRSDQISSESDQIHSQIRKLIQKSRFFIADVTFVRSSSYANVFLELGTALALGRPLVIMTQDEEIPYDIKHLRIMNYKLSDDGKERMREKLTSILQKSINPPEAILRKMLVSNDLTNYIVYGQATQMHIDKVFPPVDANYQHRLRTIASEASGISQLTIAFQKIAWGMGKDKIDIISVNGYGASDDIFMCGNIYVFGGPGANPLFNKVTDLARTLYANALNIEYEEVEHGKKRYFISKNGQKYPENQYKLYDERKDIGFVMRFSNPHNKNAVITIAAGIRTYGTEGAIKLLVTPSLISKIDLDAEFNESKEFWAIVEVTYSDEIKQLDKVKVIDSEVLVRKK